MSCNFLRVSSKWRGRLLTGLMALLGVWVLLGLPAGHAQEPVSDTPAEDGGTKASDLATYDVAINVPDENGIKSLIFESSQLLRLEDRPPPTRNALLRRIESDVSTFTAVLASKGYYDPDIRFEVTGEAAPFKVDLSIAPGPRYTLAAYEIVYLGGAPEAPLGLPDVAESGLEIGEPAVADRIAGAESTLVRWLHNRGFLYAEISDRLVLANHPDQDIWVQVTIKTGPLIRFGELQIEGLVDVLPVVVERNITWERGEVFDQSKVEDMRNHLLNANVFERVSIRPEGTASDPGGERAMLAELSESLPRSIGAGLSFSTDLGLEVTGSWEHRNLFGEAETLLNRMRIGEERQRISNSFRKPDFLARDQYLIVDLDFLKENLEAYDQTGAEGSVRLEWPVNEYLTGTWGVAYNILAIEDGGDTRQSILFGLPVGYKWDNTNNLLDPTNGSRVGVRATPWTGSFEQPVTFVTTELDGSTYLSFDSEDRVVLGLRASFGTSLGEELVNIPSNRRFYAGGGGSIRGYAYQTVGPLDASDEPLGGRSLLTMGAELRIKVTESIGIVPFYEGGNVYDDRLPDLSEPMFWSAGLGLRYYTAVGPIRFDVAFPLDRRNGVDDPFQFYISLGQAF
jgi:translocation and assembly module TamA